MKKELSRVFTDKKMILTVLILPGAMIFLLYSLMGTAFNRTSNEKFETVRIYVEENSSITEVLNQKEALDLFNIGNISFSFENKDLEEKIKNGNLDVAIKMENDQMTILYNSSNTQSKTAYLYCENTIKTLEKVIIDGKQYELNLASDLANNTSQTAPSIAYILPFLIMTFLFQGAMALGPESISGDKERGTIATLLATPVKRSEIALGKIISLSILTMLSAISSFIGVIFSLPKMLASTNFSLTYSVSDYMSVLGVLLITVLVIIGMISILSAQAKNVKEASMLALPLMLVSMVVGMTTFISPVAASNPYLYMIPLYNSAQILLAIFSFDFNLTHMVIMIVSNLIISAGLIYILTRMFNSEKVMFSK